MNLQELTAEECSKLPADILQWLKKDLNLENVEDQEELREKFQDHLDKMEIEIEVYSGDKLIETATTNFMGPRTF